MVLSYSYSAIVIRVKDGDTIAVNCELSTRFGDVFPPLNSEGLCDYGFGILAPPNISPLWFNEVTIRFALINAKEVTGVEREDGLKAKDWLTTLILGKQIHLETIKPKRATTKQRDIKDFNGRYLGLVNFNGINLNQQMLTLGLAVPYPKPS